MTAVFAWLWQPIVPPLQIIAAGAMLCACALLAYARLFRERPLLAGGFLSLRLAFVAALAALLMGPSDAPPAGNAPQRTQLSVLLDCSESMLTQDCRGGTRWDYAAAQLRELDRRAKLSDDFRVDLRRFDSELRPLPQSVLQLPAGQVATGRSTRLADAVLRTVSAIGAGETGAAVLVVSDGRDTEDAPVQGAANLARSKGVPIWTIAVGGSTSQADLAVLAVPMQEYLLPGEPGAILVKVYQAGFHAVSTQLTLRHAGRAESFPVNLENKRVVELQLPVQQAEPGQYEYEVAIDPVEGEAETNNNRQVVFLDVHTRRIKVLILEGQPFWDSKFLAASLRKDDRIELTQITQVTRRKRETIVTRVESKLPPLPQTIEQWADYDVVILGKSLERLLSPARAAQLAEFVSDHGGHVILARGIPYDPDSPAGQELKSVLAPVEPVVWGTGVVTAPGLVLTPSGRGSQWFAPTKMGVNVEAALARLPGLESAARIEREKSGTIVLARTAAAGGSSANAEGQPALVRMNYGRGTVAAVLGDGLWRWSLLSPENRDLAGFYDTFWSNLVRWLSMGGEFPPGQQVSLSLSRTSVRLGDPMAAEVVYKHHPPGGVQPALRLIEPDGRRSDVPLQRLPGAAPRYRAELALEHIGIHELQLHAPGMLPAQQHTRFNVYDVDIERLETSANPMNLRILAEHTGGRFFEAERMSELADHLRRHRQAAIVPPRLEYVWDRWFVMCLLLSWIGAEWLLRRLAGLL